MKKIEVFLLMVAVLIVFVGCQKEDGVYNPKRKITSIYRQVQRTEATYDSVQGGWIDFPETYDKEKFQEWRWKRKQLEEIDFYKHGEYVERKMCFVYDGKKMVGVLDVHCDESGEITSRKDSLALEYEGKRLIGAEIFENGAKRMVLKYTHDGDRIVSVDIKMLDAVFPDKGLDGSEPSLLQMALPMGEMAMRVMTESKSKMGIKEAVDIEFSMDFVWTGNNLSKIITKHSGEESSCMEIMYDNKKNPYYGCLGWYMEYGMMLSENNVVRQGEGVMYAYEYDSYDYPVKRSNTTTFDSDSYRSVVTTTLLYEYTK
ncbi:MAG: hypothetical protein K5867_11290 [Bacteroidales bacterium]|nr:hypothetical protein [Bacteroidales bacterium]